MLNRFVLMAAGLSLVLAGCSGSNGHNGHDAGSEDGGENGNGDGGSDAGQLPTCTSSLTINNDGTGIAQPLVISEINPGDYIEVFNNSGEEINLATSTAQFCSPFEYQALKLLSTAKIPAGGFLKLNWPTGFQDLDSGGEVILYANGAFSTSSSIMDFVCWGTNPHDSRKSQAEGVGKWSGACAGAITGGAIHRLTSTAGTSASDYDVSSAPSGTTCAP